MMTLTGIGLLIIAVSFAFISIYVVKTLKAASSTMSNVSTALERVEGQVQGITKESEHLLQKTNSIADDVKSKSQSLDPLFESLQNVGSSVGNINHSLQVVTENVENASHRPDEKVAKAMKWGDAAIQIYSKWKMKKQ